MGIKLQFGLSTTSREINGTRTMKNFTLIFLTLLLSMAMHSCMEIGLGSEAESRMIWPWTNCQTQTEMAPDCCLWLRCHTITCGFIKYPIAKSSCENGCNHLCTGSGGCQNQC